MALSLSQIDPASALLSSSTTSSSSSTASLSGGSAAGAFASQFVKQQASLAYNRYSSSDRVFIYQGIQDRAQALERAARTLFSRNYGESVFDQREVVLSSSTAVSGSAERLTSPFTFSIEVSQLAQEKKVISDDLSDAGDVFSDGTENFSLTVDGTTFNFSVSIGASDSNLDVLENIASEFNAADSSGVYAEVVSDSTSGESYLAVVAHDTGTNSDFTLSGSVLSGINLEETVAVNVSAGTGGLVVAAQDASYRIDAGSAVTSQSNTIELYDASVELTLSGTTGGEAVSVNVQPDTSQILAEVESFLTLYNDALSFALALPSEVTTPYALQLSGAVSPLVESLQSIGIERDSDGELSIDSAEFEAALTDGRFKRVSALVFGAGGVATTVERVSRDLLDDDRSFLSHPTNQVERASLLAVNRFQSIGMIVDLIA